MNQRDILRREETRRNTPPELLNPLVICARATGCEYAQDDGCPYATFRRQPSRDDLRCPATGEPVKWREK